MGFGGAKGGGRAQTTNEAENSLRSRDYVRVLFAIAEGECDGFPEDEALKNIFFDETPLRNNDGTDNFEGVTVEYRHGTPDQTPINGFNAIENEFSSTAGLPQIVRKDTPVTRTLNDVNADSVRIRIGTDAFFQRTAAGNIETTDAEFRISISNNGGPFLVRATDEFRGKSSGPYRREYNVNLRGQQGPFTIRVERLSDDAVAGQGNTDLEIRKDIYFEAFTSIRYTDSAYEGVALLALRLKADQFRSIPTVSLNWKGFNKVHVPTNYDASSRTYTGLFDGTLKTAYSTNPPWCFYEALTNQVWGVGIPEEALDVYSFYELGRYCDELVNDGQGGTHPRFTFDKRFETAGDVYEVIQAIASSMNAQTYEEGGTVKLVSEEFQEPSQIYGAANTAVQYGEDGRVEEPNFEYDSLPDNERRTAVVVRWQNPELGYREDFEEVVDTDAVIRYGYSSVSIDSVGCTRRAQAIRAGRTRLFAELFQREILKITRPSTAGIVAPGQIALTQDPDRENRRDLAGRIAEVGSNFVRVDRDVSLIAGDTCQFQTQVGGRRVVRSFTASNTTNTRVIPVSYTEDTPAPNDFWLLTIDGLREGERWKILRVTPNNDENDTYRLEGVIEPIDKRGYIESFGLADQDYGITQLFSSPTPPGDFTAVEGQYVSGGIVRNQIDLIWSPSNSPGIRRYEIGYKLAASADWNTDSTENNGYTILDLPVGSYQFRVRAVSITESVSAYVFDDNNVAGQGGAPDDLDDFYAAPIEGNLANLKWKRAKDLSVTNGGNIVIAHTPKNNGSWDDAITLATLPGTATEAQVPLMDGTYLAKALSVDGLYSINAVSAQSRLDESTAGRNFVTSQTEQDDGFPGPKLNMNVANGGLQLSIPSQRYGEYEFGTALDLSGNYACRLRGVVEMLVFRNGQPNTSAQTMDVRIQVKTDLGDGNGYGPYEDLTQNGLYQGRRFLLRLIVSSEDAALNCVITSARLLIDMPKRVAQGTIDTLLTGLVYDSYGGTFFLRPDIISQIQDAQPGDILDTDAGSNSQIGFQVLNGGTNVVRTIAWRAEGVGRRLD